MIELQISDGRPFYLHGRTYNTLVFDEIAALRFYVERALRAGLRFRLRGEKSWHTDGESALRAWGLP